MTETGRDSPQARRLRELREKVHGFSGHGGQKAFAEFLRIDSKRYNNFERGFPISRQIEDILVARTPGLTVDWLRHGDPRHLSVELARTLGAIPRAAPIRSRT